MKKLFSNKPGSLKDKFEGLEEVPSLKSWRHLESELTAINAGIAKRRKRKRLVAFMAAASMIALIFMVGSLDFGHDSAYKPRTVNGFENPITSEDDWRLMVRESNNESGNTDLLASQDNIPTDFVNDSHNNALDTGAERTFTNATDVKNKVPGLSKLSVEYAPIAIQVKQLEPEHLDPPKSRRKLSPKWRINLSGGQDISRNALAPRSAAAFANNSTGRPIQSWSFEPYTHQLPIVLSAGIERRISKSLSAHVNMDYQMLRAVAETPYQLNNRTAIKKGRLDQFGMAIGLTAELLQTNRIRGFIGVEAWAAHATNSYTEITQLNGNSKEASISEVQLTPSSILSARAMVGMKYRLTEKMSFTGSVLATKPIHNYMNELNVYNNGEKYIPGFRLGLSMAI